MFTYPKKAHFGRVVPKNRIYTHAKVSKRVKELFVLEIGEILWKYKLSPETTNLPARGGINEIQVFEIALKTPDIDDAVIQAMDKAIPFPLLLQFTHDGQIRFAASYRRPSEADASKWVVGGALKTEPQPEDAERLPLPVALDLAGLYEQIVRRHIPLRPRPGESIVEHLERFNSIKAKRKAQQQLKTQLAQEKQFNRKVALNAALRVLSRELQTLSQA